VIELNRSTRVADVIRRSLISRESSSGEANPRLAACALECAVRLGTEVRSRVPSLGRDRGNCTLLRLTMFGYRGYLIAKVAIRSMVSG
jgi:hypothetical protein